jgi:hypothetical protein
MMNAGIGRLTESLLAERASRAKAKTYQMRATQHRIQPNLILTVRSKPKANNLEIKGRSARCFQRAFYLK